MVMQNYFYLYAYNNGDISARGLEGIKTFLRVQAEMGIKRPAPVLLYDQHARPGS